MQTIFKLKKWFLLGILLRLLIMPFTGHWDLTSLHQVADSLWHSGQSAAYSFYYAIYPPLTYLFLGLWQKLISPLVFSDFRSFLNDPVGVVFMNPHAFRYLFLLKLPYVFFDLGIGFLLYSLVEKEKKKEKIFKLWMLNPITLYATFAWGTIDLIPAFLVILALFFAQKQKGYWAVLALGLGASFKAFPFLFLLPFCLVYFSSWKDRLKAFVLGLAPFVITVLPFMGDKNFLLQFFSSEQLQVIQHAGFYIGREENISLYYIFYSLLIFFLSRRHGVKFNLNWLFFLVIFVFYALASFTPQWLIWGAPLLFLVLVENDISLFWYVFILAIYILLVLMFEVTLNLGLLAPLEVTLLDYPSWGEKINSLLSVTRIDGLLRSVFSAIILWLVFLSKPKQKYENS